VSQDSDKPGPEEAAEQPVPTLSIEGADELIKEATEAQQAREGGGIDESIQAGEGDVLGMEGIEALRQELEVAKDRYLRIQADFDNFRRRTLRERQELQTYGHENFVKDLLPTVDNLERTLDHAAGDQGEEILTGLIEGVELVLRELLAVMKKHGITPVEAQGKTFDPSYHEAMSQVPDDTVPANTVLDVFQTGYELRNRLLRPARVIVSTRSAQQGPTSDAREGEGKG